MIAKARDAAQQRNAAGVTIAHSDARPAKRGRVVAVAAVAFAVGWLGHRWMSAPPRASVAPQRTTAPIAAAAPTAAAKPATAVSATASGPAAIRSMIATAQRAPTHAARLMAFAIGLEHLDATEYPALMQALRATNTPERPDELAMLCAAWARRAGAEAFAAARELASRDGVHAALHAAIAAWASQDPAAARAALVSVGLDALAGDEMTAFLRGWAGSDPAAVEAYLQTIPVAPDAAGTGLPVAAQCGYEAIARARVALDPARALAWYRELHAPLQERLRQAMATELTTANPALAHRWLTEDPAAQLGVSDLVPLLRASHLEGFAQQFAWAQTAANPTTRESALDAVVREGMATDAVRLGEWLAARADDAALAPAFSAYALQVVRKSPNAAITWALSLDQPELRQQTLATVAAEWITMNPRAAREWAQRTKLVDYESLVR